MAASFDRREVVGHRSGRAGAALREWTAPRRAEDADMPALAADVARPAVA